MEHVKRKQLMMKTIPIDTDRIEWKSIYSTRRYQKECHFEEIYGHCPMGPDMNDKLHSIMLV